MPVDNGGPAFPVMPDAHGSSRYYPSPSEGMSLRDWFAGQALAMTASAYVNLPESAEILVRRCYAVADAMLAERVKEPSNARG